VTSNPGVSIRSVNGADAITAPVLRQLAKHPLTGKGLTCFLKDWSATGQKIV
jgi:hypothetical protein